MHFAAWNNVIVYQCKHGGKKDIRYSIWIERNQPKCQSTQWRYCFIILSPRITCSKHHFPPVNVTIATAKFDGGPQMALYFIATAEKWVTVCTSSYAQKNRQIHNEFLSDGWPQTTDHRNNVHFALLIWLLVTLAFMWIYIDLHLVNYWFI